jgi:hypothetical protein
MTKVPKIIIPLEMASCHLEKLPNLPIIKSPKNLYIKMQKTPTSAPKNPISAIRKL